MQMQPPLDQILKAALFAIADLGIAHVREEAKQQWNDTNSDRNIKYRQCYY